MKQFTALWNAYVIEVSPAPGMPVPTLPDLYVGVTTKTAEERLAKHLGGGRGANKEVAKRGGRLRPDLYSQYPAARGEREAWKLEERVATELRSQGYTVHAGSPGGPWLKFRRKFDFED